MFLRAIRRVVTTHPGGTLAGILGLTVVFAALSTQVVVDADTNNFAPDNEQFRAAEAVAEEFETNAAVLGQVAITGDDVFSPAGLAAVTEIRSAILGNDALAAALVSDAPSPVISFLDPVLGAAAEQQVDLTAMDDDAFDAFATQVFENLPPEQAGAVLGLLGSDREGFDASAGIVIAFIDGSEAVDEAVRDDAWRAFADLRGLADGFEVHPLNELLLIEEVNEGIQSQMGTLLGVAFLLIIGILVAIYRRVSDVVSSLLGLVLAIVWMQGIGVLLGPGWLGLIGGQSEMSMMIPILLVGLGVDYGIHLTMRYREQRVAGDEPAGAAGGAIVAVGTALVLATMTTVVGFLTNVTNPLPPLRDFGVTAAVGVTCAFLIMATFVPAMRLLLDNRAARRGRLKPIKVRRHGRASFLGHVSASFAPIAVRHPVRVLTVGIAVTVAGAIGSTQLSTAFSQTDFFPEESDALATMNAFQDNFGGDLGEVTDILVRGEVATVEAFAGLAALHEALTDDPGVRTAEGAAQAESILVLVQQAGLLEQDPASDADVATLYQEAIAQVPGAGAYVSPDEAGGWDALLVRVSTQVQDQVAPLLEDLNADITVLEEAGLDVSITSNGILNDAVLTELRDSQLASLVLTLVASMLILALAFWVRNRRPMLGVLSIATVGMVVFWVFGLMAAFGIPFNVMTAMVSALAVGIGVPFGIHVVNRYLEDHRREPDVLTAMSSTLENTGGALMGSALTTVAGFGVLTLASITPMRQFGLVTALTISLAVAAAILVLPALLTLWSRHEDRRHEPSGDSDKDAPTAQPELVGAAR